MALLLTGGRLLDPRGGTADPAEVLVVGDRIAAVDTRVARSADVRLFDASGKLLIPGLVNSHTHAHANLVKGIADNWTLEDLLNHSMALWGQRSPEEHYLSAALGAAEMLKSGCTAAYDLVSILPTPDDEALAAVVQAYVDVGLRAVIAPAVADMAFIDTVPGLKERLPPRLVAAVDQPPAATAQELLDVCERFIERWDRGAGGRIRAAMAPTVPGQCSDELLRGCHRISEEYGVAVHAHVAETEIETVHAHNRWGMSIVEALDYFGLLGPRFVGAHGVWLTHEDMRLLGARGAMVAHNPASNLKLGTGIAPVRELIHHGVQIGLGTDGSTASDNQNMFEAMRFAALVNKVRHPYRSEEWIGGPDAYAMATTGGARLLGMSQDVGAIAPGYKADITMLDAGSVWLTPSADYRMALAYAETGQSVDTVMVDGEILVRDGVVTSIDEARLVADGARVAESLRHRQRSAWALAEEVEPYLQAACTAVAG